MVAAQKKIALVICILLACLGQFEAMRPLNGDQWGMKDELVLQSLQRGPVTPSGPNPCTFIPGRGTGTCRLNGMNVAGNVVRSPLGAFPRAVLKVGVAFIAKAAK